MTPPPDEYLRTQQVAKALGVSASTVKRWVDSGALRATRTPGKHRLVPRREVERFAREMGLPFGAAAGLEPVEVGEGLVEALAGALRRGRAVEARELIERAFATAGPVTLADEVIRPVMALIGRDWEVNGLDIFQEHRATRIVKLALFELARRQLEAVAAGPEAPAPLALGAAPEDDPYMLPGLLCELTLRELGWEVMNLGVNLPLGSLAEAVRAHRPRLVWLSVGYLEDPRRFRREYATFFDTAAAAGAAVILGGRALTPELRGQLKAAGFGDRMAHLAEFAKLVQRSRPDAAAPTDRPGMNRL